MCSSDVLQEPAPSLLAMQPFVCLLQPYPSRALNMTSQWKVVHVMVRAWHIRSVACTCVQLHYRRDVFNSLCTRADALVRVVVRVQQNLEARAELLMTLHASHRSPTNNHAPHLPTLISG